ncbi:hypothetical protein NEOLEDRAFT_505302 [Neolentinus lepideus HHB14362 ss-1]|uniref:Uncharacterized protein n=1 Tax=Neolentinus lepideus HHB14362 ss-1 TaxID=1314782 RepID=A0A165RJB0_9AGAM|nr:hypothetical protein NEOLEDRAFT_505302 [Neolentinus lepideus HHB14362 ss-1]
MMKTPSTGAIPIMGLGFGALGVVKVVQVIILYPRSCSQLRGRCCIADRYIIIRFRDRAVP